MQAQKLEKVNQIFKQLKGQNGPKKTKSVKNQNIVKRKKFEVELTQKIKQSLKISSIKNASIHSQCRDNPWSHFQPIKIPSDEDEP